MPTTAKGKGKADPRLPLLTNDNDAENDYGSTSQASQDAQHHQQQRAFTASPVPIQRAWRSYLLTGALALLTLLFGGSLAIILLADSYAAPALRNINNALSADGATSNQFWEQAVIVRGPDKINIAGIGRRTDDTGKENLELNLTVTVRLAVDSDFVMDLRDSRHDSWATEKWKSLGRWGVRRLGTVTAAMDDIVVYPANMSIDTPIVSLKSPSAVPIQLIPGLTPEDHQHPLPLRSVTIPLTISPSQNATLILDFLKKSWMTGFANVQIHSPDMMVHGGEPDDRVLKWWRIGSWRQWLKVDKSDVAVKLRLQIPPFKIPTNPPTEPGSEFPNIADLLVLESFRITSSNSVDSEHISPSSSDNSRNKDAQIQKVLGSSTIETSSVANTVLVTARASLPHPFSSLVSKINLGKDFTSLPFIISLPIPNDTESKDRSLAANIPIVSVSASPEFNLTHMRIDISGHVLPLSNSSDLPKAISSFVSSYLSYQPSPISVFSPLYPSMEINAKFPPPSHRLELLRDVRIENMSIHPGLVLSNNPGFNFEALDILASAQVFARVVLPHGIDIDVEVKRLWVDCLVYDGEVSDKVFTHPFRNGKDDGKSKEPPLPEPMPLPKPLPPRAFGRITPRTWLNATSYSGPVEDEESGKKTPKGDDGRSVYVRADVVDVPLEVLPGRQNELRKFVTKVLFSTEPVVAGVTGVAAVGITVPGLTSAGGPRIEGSELILTGLPFEGKVNVGGHNFNA